ncbi:5,10-methylenetetrahydrofolate reductase [Gluconacetobacter johannae DSM 13595]|uniref:Methylenetetrahydrofolate reductase n=1 Tax=Gluconacetobacter johannae TaxID=112140 RepID=A0A7W4J5A7_9PROT|nr:methylenetetrahydrofolate reductase [NAD(P)H] [Gluconacetobacter johannae]MBB2175000.1 methylenetetrahydrofolate reductase [NAD(P)H] [Gluconacetobacter johannae]GBQ87405.1 5,10-methylenetetrahydrofolate reductase [Gluconacetobacter johannae DSM 13595]
MPFPLTAVRPLSHVPALGPVEVSFEFFPPKSTKMEDGLRQTVGALAPLGPRFLSVTYGAGGSTRDRTLATIAALAHDTSVPVAAHLTCVDATRGQVDDVARAYWAAGIRHIVALRGDPTTPGSRFVPHPDGYENAAALVAGLRRIAPFEISVAAYPETHPDAASPQADLDNLKAKIDAGATRAITQFFFEAETFLRFRDRAAAAGIDAEILPGILPVANIAQAYKFADMCGARVPDWMRRLFDGLDDQPATRALVTTATAAELCRQLRAGGVSRFHFYTLNRAEACQALCRLLVNPQ